SFFVPTWEQMGNAFANTWTWPRLMSDVFPSVLRLIVGIILSIVIGIVVGLLVGSFRWLRQLMEPTMEFFRAIPPTVLIPVFMLLIGIGDDMKIAVIILGAVWPILLNTSKGCARWMRFYPILRIPIASMGSRGFGIGSCHRPCQRLWRESVSRYRLP